MLDPLDREIANPSTVNVDLVSLSNHSSDKLSTYNGDGNLHNAAHQLYCIRTGRRVSQNSSRRVKTDDSTLDLSKRHRHFFVRDWTVVGAFRHAFWPACGQRPADQPRSAVQHLLLHARGPQNTATYSPLRRYAPRSLDDIVDLLRVRARCTQANASKQVFYHRQNRLHRNTTCCPW